MNEWRDIRTAPTTDEFRCLVYSREIGQVMVGEWVAGSGYWAEVLGDACEFTDFNRPLTHWMPLPEPPP